MSRAATDLQNSGDGPCFMLDARLGPDRLEGAMSRAATGKARPGGRGL